MYTIINQNVGALLKLINPQADINPYVWLLGELPNRNVAQDQEFQRIYRLYWQLNPARLSKEYLAAYFGHLEQLKGHPEHITGLHPIDWTKYVRVVGRNQIPCGREKGTCHEAPKELCC